jgi:hypothetical protein
VKGRSEPITTKGPRAEYGLVSFSRLMVSPLAHTVP